MTFCIYYSGESVSLGKHSHMADDGNSSMEIESVKQN